MSLKCCQQVLEAFDAAIAVAEASEVQAVSATAATAAAIPGAVLARRKGIATVALAAVIVRPSRWRLTLACAGVRVSLASAS